MQKESKQNIKPTAQGGLDYMKEMKKKENPIIEHLKLLKKHGKLNDEAFLSAIDALSDSENPYAVNEYLDGQAVAIADIALNGKPFEIADESVDGLLRFGITEDGKPVGINPDECHFLIAGQTNTGKSTLLKIIFAQALLLNERGKSGENNLLALRQGP